MINRFLPPYIIYKGKKLYDIWCPKNGYKGTRYNTSPSGWIEEPIFFDWFQNHFIPHVKEIERPVFLLFDGHRSHISVRTIQLAMEEGIHLECLPPHTTTILQPLDVVTLSKVKTSWRKILRAHNRETNSQSITKARFALLVIFLKLYYSNTSFFL